MAETRKPFIYIAIIAVIFGLIGIVMIMQNKGMSGNAISGVVVLDKDKYSSVEIAKHNTNSDCWISYENEVYDLTLFLQIYPEELSGKCGGNLGSFKQEDVSLLNQYKIGELE